MAAMLMLALILSIPVSSSETSESVVHVRGGGAVLLEHVTGVWCDVCADHEPWVAAMVESNDERLIRVDLHDVIEDPLGNEAATHRRIRLNHTLPFPTYHMDGHAESTSSVSRGELQMSLLAAESARKTHEVLEATITTNESGGIVTVAVTNPIQVEGTQLTLLLLETSVTIPIEEATNGLLVHPAVLQSVMSIEIGGNKTIKPLAWGGVEMSEGSGLNAIFEFNWPEGVNADTVTLVVVHEVVEVGNGPATLSAISWAVEAPSEDVQGAGWVVLLLIGCAFVSLFLRSRSSS
tara:strand:- start:1507 stop:2385 length:879 start_codon:yes stop_codon:yes gene_type:complete